MPNNIDRNVNLDVRDFPTNPPQGYTNVTASNGQLYSYRYTGGDDGNGGAAFDKNGGQGKVNVSLGTSDSRYTISSISFSGDGAGDFSYTPGPRTSVIFDTAKDAETVKYTVYINDSSANCSITCDPQIINRS